MAEYASHAVGSAGLTTGIIGTALGALNSGLLGGTGVGGLFGGSACSENMAVNRYELNMQRDLVNKDMEIAYLKGRDAAKTDSIELYRYIDGKFAHVERELCDQRTYNATNTAAIGCIQKEVNQLMSLAKFVIPNSSICPGWDTTTTGT